MDKESILSTLSYKLLFCTDQGTDYDANGTPALLLFLIWRGGGGLGGAYRAPQELVYTPLATPTPSGQVPWEYARYASALICPCTNLGIANEKLLYYFYKGERVE